MVNFEMCASPTELKILINGKHLGYISKEHGFYTDPTFIKEFTEASSADFRQIANKIDEVTRKKPSQPMANTNVDGDGFSRTEFSPR